MPETTPLIKAALNLRVGVGFDVYKEIYGKFENLQMFPGMGADLSKRVSFRTDYKYAIWEDYVIIYKVGNEYVEIYRVVNRYQDITRIFD